MNALSIIEPASNVDQYRASTDAATLCKDIVVASAKDIQGRRYVCVEGWQAIAVAHGCAASARGVERVDGGIRAIGEVRRMSDGVVIAEAEGFVGEDETTWFGGTARKWKWGSERGQKVWYDEEMPKRADYAIRAMAQTRAISRACRSAFAHVVVMMNAGLSTTPAEEVPQGGFDDASSAPEPRHDPTPVDPPRDAVISPEQRDMIRQLAQAKGIDAKKLCEVGGIASIPDMPAAMFDQCKRWIEKQPAKPAPEPAHASDVLDDEVPY